MLHINNLHAYWQKSHVLHGVTFDVQPGEIVACWAATVFGPARPPPKPSWGWWIGKATCNGIPKDLEGKALHEIAHLGLGYVPRAATCFPNLTVRRTCCWVKGQWQGQPLVV